MGLLDDAWNAAQGTADDFHEWNNPEELAGAPVDQDPGDLTEDILIDQHGWSEEAADDAVPDTAVESITDAGEGLIDIGGKSKDAAGDVYNTVTNPTSLVPWYVEWAIPAFVLTTILAVASYAFGQLFDYNLN